jgi:hypothetical protein
MEALGIRHCPRPPVHWFGHPAIGPSELAVLLVLLAHSSPDGTCWPSQSRIASILKRSRTWANGIIARLSGAGLIEADRRHLSRGGETSCRYRIISAEQESGASPGDASRRTPESGKTRLDGSVASRADFPQSAADNPCRTPGTPCQSADTNTTHTNPREETLSAARERGKENERGFIDGDAGPPNPQTIPENWVPSPEDAAWALARHPGLDVLRYTERFILTCRAKGYRYADPAAAWRRWLIEPKGQLPKIHMPSSSTKKEPNHVRHDEYSPRHSVAAARDSQRERNLDKANRVLGRVLGR